MFYEFSIGGFEECAETLVERRSDEAFKLLLLRTRVTKFIERMLETSNDSLTRVAQGTVRSKNMEVFRFRVLPRFVAIPSCHQLELEWFKPQQLNRKSANSFELEG
jgi:hypothetical protein